MWSKSNAQCEAHNSFRVCSLSQTVLLMLKGHQGCHMWKVVLGKTRFIRGNKHWSSGLCSGHASLICIYSAVQISTTLSRVASSQGCGMGRTFTPCLTLTRERKNTLTSIHLMPKNTPLWAIFNLTYSHAKSALKVGNSEWVGLDRVERADNK